MKVIKSFLSNQTSLLLRNKTNLILFSILALIILIGSFFGIKLISKNQASSLEQIEEIELAFDPEGAYALLVPRKDGKAIYLELKRIGSYDSFSYQLSYTDQEGIGRGAGDPNTWIKVDKGKSEYEQLILLGSCSQGFTSGDAHCVFDKGVENGNLILKMRTSNKAYVMKTTWHLQKPDIALGLINSVDGHFSYKTSASRENLTVVGFTIVNDLSAAPKLPEGKKILGKVYALNLPTAKDFSSGQVSLELIDNPPSGATLARYVESKNSWEILDTKTALGNKFSATSDGEGIFTVLIDSK